MTQSEQYFCRLMEADDAVREDLLRYWARSNPVLAGEVRRMWERFQHESLSEREAEADLVQEEGNRIFGRRRGCSPE